MKDQLLKLPVKLIMVILIFFTAGSTAAQTPRNIILVIADDVGAEQLRSYTHTLQYGDKFNPAPLPTIKRLVGAGIRFTQAWSNPSCSPTRAGIHTGQYCCKHGIYSPTDVTNGLVKLVPHSGVYELLPANMPPEYEKALLGKWHLGTIGEPYLPNADGWDYYAGGLGGELSSYIKWQKTINGKTLKDSTTTHATIDLANDAKDWIRTKAKNNTPFLAVLAFNAPHATMPVDPKKGGVWTWSYLDLSYGACWDYSMVIKTDTIGIYKAQLQCLDYELGEIIDFMNSSFRSVLDNTIIIFIGDNGTPKEVAEDFLKDSRYAKGSVYQGGIHVPFIIADGHYLTDPLYKTTNEPIGKITSPGSVSNALVHTRDLYATILELAGVTSVSIPTKSHSLVKFMLDPAASGEHYVITEGEKDGKKRPEVAIRNAHYKFIQFANGDEEFYKIDLNKWDDASSWRDIPGLTGTEKVAYDDLKARLKKEMECN